MPLLTPEERLGTEVGSWILDRVIGEGGMGVVFAARHKTLGSKAAIKLLHPHLLRSESVAKRFEREAQAAAAIQHPNVVRILDVLSAEDGARCIVMDFLEGESLHRRLKRVGALSPIVAADFLLPVMDALSQAHARGIVHRDLKPDNVFLAREGTGEVPKLLDFGIAKLLGGDGTGTRTGMLMGTPAYMAPEQARGSKDVGPPADVWAMGCVWFECLTGRTPFVSDTPQAILASILTEPPPMLRQISDDVPAHWAGVVDRALARDVAERFPDMGSFADAIRAALKGPGGEVVAVPSTQVNPMAPTLATPMAASVPPPDPSRAPTVLGTPPIKPAKKKKKRMRSGVIVGAFTALLSAAGTVAILDSASDAEPPPMAERAQPSPPSAGSADRRSAPGETHRAIAPTRTAGGGDEGDPAPITVSEDADAGVDAAQDSGFDADADAALPAEEEQADASVATESEMRPRGMRATMAQQAEMDTTPPFTAQEVRRELDRRSLLFRQCGNVPRAQGREYPETVSATFTVRADGRIEDVEIDRRIPFSLINCVKTRLHSTRLRSGAEPLRVTHGFPVTPR
ncbi:MAG: protein kinase [Myxococcota bacterium]